MSPKESVRTGHGGAGGRRTTLPGGTGRVFSTAVLGGATAVTLAEDLQCRLLTADTSCCRMGQCPLALGTFP